MNHRAHYNEDAGYTLAELAVGMAVTAVIASVAAFLVIGSISGLEQSRRATEQVQAAHVAWRHMSDEFRRADQVALHAEGWTVSLGNSVVTYRLADGGLVRNDHLFAPAPGTRLDGRLREIAFDDTLRGHSLTIAAAGHKDVAITSTVRRAPKATWEPLRDR